VTQRQEMQRDRFSPSGYRDRASSVNRAVENRLNTREVMQHAIIDLADRGYSDYEIASITQLSVAIVRETIARRHR
jgi:hypothetical protein